MKSRRTYSPVSDALRILMRGSVVVLVLLCLAFWAAKAKAEPGLPVPVQVLPTRPPSKKPSPSKPTPEPSESKSEPGEPPAATPVPPTPTPIPTPSVDVTFEELGRSTFQLSESRTEWVDLYLPRHFVPNSGTSTLDLTISHTPPEPDKLSVIRVTLNSAPLAVIPLSPENASRTTSRFYLQDAPLVPGRNRLSLSLDAGASCNVRGASVDVVVYESSSFHVEYTLTQPDPDLALYPVPFFERSLEIEPVYVVLPENPSATDLSAAATIAAGLGKFSDGDIRLVSALDAQISSGIRDNHHLIVIGKKGANRLLDQLDLPLSLDDPTLSAEQGVVQQLISPWDALRMILVVTGDSDAGLSKASQALNREVDLLSMEGSVAVVRSLSPSEVLESGEQSADFTLADLGYEEAVVYGTAPHVLDYDVYISPGTRVAEGSRFVLSFGHAATASPTNSVLDVAFNDVPVRSVLLDESNASEAVLEVPLPSWLIRPERNRIRISIEMNLDDEDKCLFLDDQRLWTAVYSDSYFHLPVTGERVEPSLDLFPYPFNEEPSLSSLLVVLPDRPRQIDYDLMLEVATGLGAADQGDALALDVITADLVTQEGRQDKDLLLIGLPSVHSLITELNDELPQPFRFRSNRLPSQVESVVPIRDPSGELGVIEELAAPWDYRRTVLVLTGTADEGLVLVSTALFSQGDALAGNVVLVEEAGVTHAFDTRALPPASASLYAGGESNLSVLMQLGERWW
jgi:hypothetical protein